MGKYLDETGTQYLVDKIKANRLQGGGYYLPTPRKGYEQYAKIFRSKWYKSFNITNTRLYGYIFNFKTKLYSIST